MKNIITLLFLTLSLTLFSQSWNSDYNLDQSDFDNTWSVNLKVSENVATFNWEKDVVTTIVVTSESPNSVQFEVDAFMTSELHLNSLQPGTYKVMFLDDCRAIMTKKEFTIK